MRVLCYHSISDAPDDWSVPPSRFAWQTRWLARTLGAARVALSFDDGYADFLHVWPWLRGFGFRVMVFAVSAKLGGVADWEGAVRLPLLAQGDLSALAQQGVEIGAHSATHARLSQLPPEAARAQIVQARAQLEAVTGAPVRRFAYPYGEATPALVAMVRAAGFEQAYVMRSGYGRARLATRRIPVAGADGALRFALKALTGYASWVDLRMDVRGVPG